MPEILYAIQLDYNSFRYAALKALPLDVIQGDIQVPTLRRNLAQFFEGCPIKLGSLVMTDLDKNELLIRAEQRGVLIGYIKVCRIRDRQEYKINHLLGKPMPDLITYV